MATKKIKRGTKKTDTVNFKNSIKSFQNTVDTINDKISDTTGDIFEEVVNNSEKIRKTAKSTFSKAMDTVSETVTVDNFKSTAKQVNNYTLKTADELLDVAIESGDKWHNIADKTVKGGLKLAAKQQDIVFDALEMVKGQFSYTMKRVKKLMK